jgi:hypothetical protein
MPLEIRDNIIGILSDRQEWETILVSSHQHVFAGIDDGYLTLRVNGQTLFSQDCGNAQNALLKIHDFTKNYALHAAWTTSSPGSNGWLAKCETLAYGKEPHLLWKELLPNREVSEWPKNHLYQHIDTITEELVRTGSINAHHGDWRYILKDTMPVGEEDMTIFLDSITPAGASENLRNYLKESHDIVFGPLLEILWDNLRTEQFHQEHPEQGWQWSEDEVVTEKPKGIFERLKLLFKPR